MRYIKKIAVLTIAIVISASGFSVIAEEVQDDSLKTEKIEITEKTKDNKFKKKNFKRNKKEKVELTEEQKAAKLEAFKAKLAESLASGKITQEKYEKILSSFESGKFKPFNKHDNGKGRHFKKQKSSDTIEEKVIKE